MEHVKIGVDPTSCRRRSRSSTIASGYAQCAFSRKVTRWSFVCADRSQGAAAVRSAYDLGVDARSAAQGVVMPTVIAHAVLMDVADMDAVMAAMQTDAMSDAMAYDGVLPETLVILVEA
jgi:hypothetical protein